MHWSLRAPWKNLRSSQLLGGSKKPLSSIVLHWKVSDWLAVAAICATVRGCLGTEVWTILRNYTQIDFGKAIWNVCHRKVINTAIHLLHCAHVTWLLGLIRDNTRPIKNRKLLRKIKDTFWLDVISDHILGREHFNILHGRQVVALCGFWSKISKCLFEIFCRIYAASGTLEEKQQESANHLMENFQEEDNPHFTSFSFSIVFAFCFSRVLLVLVVYSTDWLHISCVHSRWIAAQLFRTFQLCNASWLNTMWLQLQGSARNTLDRIFWCWSSPFQSAVSIYAFEHLPEID